VCATNQDRLNYCHQFPCQYPKIFKKSKDLPVCNTPTIAKLSLHYSRESSSDDCSSSRSNVHSNLAFLWAQCECSLQLWRQFFPPRRQRPRLQLLFVLCPLLVGGCVVGTGFINITFYYSHLNAQCEHVRSFNCFLALVSCLVRGLAGGHVVGMGFINVTFYLLSLKCALVSFQFFWA
jgi:hypothetical protein